MRQVRTVLSDAGEDAWSRRLQAALTTTARRRPPSPALVTTLQDLRASEASARLGLVPLLDRVLDEVRAG